MKFLFLLLLLSLSLFAIGQDSDASSEKKLLITNSKSKDSIIFDKGDFLRVKQIEGRIIKGELSFGVSDTIIIAEQKIAVNNIEKCCELDTKRYKHGKHLLITGAVISSIGLISIVYGTIQSNAFLGGFEFYLIGAAAEIVSLPFFISGAYYQNQKYKHDFYRGWKNEIVEE